MEAYSELVNALHKMKFPPSEHFLFCDWGIPGTVYLIQMSAHKYVNF